MKSVPGLLIALPFFIASNPGFADYIESRVRYAQGTYRLIQASPSSRCPQEITVAVEQSGSTDSFTEIVITAVPQESEKLAFSRFSIPRESINTPLLPTREYDVTVPLRKVTQSFSLSNSARNHKNAIIVRSRVELILDRQMNKFEFPSWHEFQMGVRRLNYFYSIWTGNEPASIANETAACQYDKEPLAAELR